MTERSSTDVLVVGGGPAGCAAAIRLAAVGHQVTVLERSGGLSPVARGDLLVPAAVDELVDLGIDLAAIGANPITGTRLWHGRTVRSRALARHADQHVGRRSRTPHRSQCGTAQNGRRRSAPTSDSAHVRPPRRSNAASCAVRRSNSRTARPGEIGCRFLVVADGANSRFGRGLGTHRDRRWPYAISASTYVTSDRSTDSWIETSLGPPDANGHPVTGHGWVHPVGDGTLNIGVTVLSSYRDVRGVNIVKLLDSFAESVAQRWRFDPTERLVEPVRRRRRSVGRCRRRWGRRSSSPATRPGMANPFNSHGVRAALATGRTAADVLDEALTVGNSTTLQLYPALLDEALGRYHKVGRLTARFLGRPWLLRTALASGIRSDAAMGAALRIATNELRTAKPVAPSARIASPPSSPVSLRAGDPSRIAGRLRAGGQWCSVWRRFPGRGRRSVTTDRARITG